MPVTPFHFGPGLLVKGLAPTRFSMSTFVAVEVVIDVETIVNLSAQRWPIHTWAHTLPGSFVVAAAVGALVWIARRPLSGLLKRVLPTGSIPNAWMDSETAASGVVAGAVCGAVSASLLDAIMHSDVMPFWPLLKTNPLHGCIGSIGLHAACVVTGGIGLVVLLVKGLVYDRTA